MGKRRKPTELELQRENKLQRIQAMYPPERVEKILKVEKAWEKMSYRLDLRNDRDPIWFNELQDKTRYELLQHENIQRLIHGAAKRWARLYKHRRLTFEDFLSVFYQTAWKVIDDYSWATDFYLYETMSRAIQKRGISVLRESRRDKRRVLHEALPLFDGWEDLI